MADLLTSSLSQSFRTVPPAAVPAMLDCISTSTDSVLEVVSETNNWELIEASLAPILLRSVGFSLDMCQNEDKSVIVWSRCSIFQSSRDLQKSVSICDNAPVLPLTLSCYILSRLLDAAAENYQAVKGSSISGNIQSETFCGNLLWDLCNLTIQMLSQSLDHRSCTTSLLLPSIFKAFSLKCSYEVCIQGESCCISRQHFFMNLWKCSRVLFAMGLAERRDAYGIISLYLSYFSSVDRSQVEMDDHRAEEFDVRAEKEFWNEIKRGLVENEGLIRKQSLYILKRVMLINDGGQLNPVVTEKKSRQRGPVPHGMTKRDVWAEEEAKSLGVGQICLSADVYLSEKQKWEAFVLLYEMLDEYGTHLVEAAWNHQIMLLLQSCVYHESVMDPEASNQQINMLGGNFGWLAILWERGLFHDNPHGLKGFHSSKTIEGASKFLYQYCKFLHGREHILFLRKLASVARQQSLGRAGLMSLSECIFSASKSSKNFSAEGHVGTGAARQCINALPTLNGMESSRTQHWADKADFIDSLRFLVENCKQHFNPNYRLREVFVPVCERVLEAAVSVVCPEELSLETILHFIAALPREFTDTGGSLRFKVQKWFIGNHKLNNATNCASDKMQIVRSLWDFLGRFSSHIKISDVEFHYDDEDLVAWFTEAERWARVLFLYVEDEHQLDPLFRFIEEKGVSSCQQGNLGETIPVKYLILLLSLVHELEFMQLGSDECTKTQLKVELNGTADKNCLIAEKFADVFLVILKDLISFAESSCSIFWSHVVVDGRLPGSVTGKLGGPSRRRLSSPMTTAVLQAIVSVRTVATVSSWCTHFKDDAGLNLAFTFLWNFLHLVVSSAFGDCETSAEINLAAYEALSFALKASAPVNSSSTVFNTQDKNSTLDPVAKNRPLLDSLVLTFLNHINGLLGIQQLARTRRAILMNWKFGHDNTFFSNDAVSFIFADLVESLETAGEDSALSMLRSVRMVLDLLTSSSSFVSGCNGVDAQMIWQLVRSSWILHSSCNKRRVAPIAALLSAVLHASVFRLEEMHVTDIGPGPLKWLCEKVFEEGIKSPRTIRLAALHLTGLWLLNPGVIKYYVKELKLLTLYGSIAFDEDFEGELTENGDARTEVSLLAKVPDSEITNAYINTELYARVSVAVLFYKLAEVAKMAGSGRETDKSCSAIESGKMFLLELLDSTVNDKDLAKELYKKHSAVSSTPLQTHRRKVRAWQMLCILSRFIDQDIVLQVIQSLSISFVTAEKWVPIIEVPVNSVKNFLEKKKREGFAILGLEQTANSIPLDKYSFPQRTVLVLGREKEGIPADIIHVLDTCIEIPQLGVVRSLNVHVSGAIAIWEYTRQQRSR
uniref:tRNA/rRNA methyltransferase SpoU type domain-containing protein n=1 Tax=Chenopodium quinoa TaxID=63459 RepID=A0A803L5M7_CHEQI